MQRTFAFDAQWETYPEQIERLRGTPAKIHSLIAGIAQPRLAQRVGDRWSIQENIAHLADLDEVLFMPRIREFERGASTMLAADVTNATTNNAGHNERTISEVLGRFERVRGEMVARLESLPHGVFGRMALQPRLKRQITLTGLVYFIGEHDDYHMAHISQLKAKL